MLSQMFAGIKQAVATEDVIAETFAGQIQAAGQLAFSQSVLPSPLSQKSSIDG